MEGQGSAARRILNEKCSKTTEKIKNEEARGCHLAEVNDQLRAEIGVNRKRLYAHIIESKKGAIAVHELQIQLATLKSDYSIAQEKLVQVQELLKQLKQADQRSKKEVFAGDLELQEFYKDEERFWQHNMEEKCNIVKRIAEIEERIKLECPIDDLKSQILVKEHKLHTLSFERDKLKQRATMMARDNEVLIREKSSLVNESLQEKHGTLAALKNAKAALEGLFQRGLNAEIELQQTTNECKKLQDLIDKTTNRSLQIKAQLYSLP